MKVNREKLDEIEKAKSATAYRFYERADYTLKECHQELHLFAVLLDTKFAQHTPSLSAIKKPLEEVQAFFENYLDKTPAPEAVDASDNNLVSGEDATMNPSIAAITQAASVTGVVQTRAEALRRLGEAAEYFHQAEPHSPVYHLIKRAIKWGHMPLEDWLQEVIKEHSVLAHLRDTLGLEEKKN